MILMNYYSPKKSYNAVRNTPGIGVFITPNYKRGATTKGTVDAKTKVLKHQDGLTKKNLLEIINDQSSQIYRLKQIIDGMKNNSVELFHGNCDPDMTIHRKKEQI